MIGIQAPNTDGKNQFLLENTTVTVIILKFDCGIMVLFVKNKGNMVI